jgi:methyl-accepting chemotaxis protein
MQWKNLKLANKFGVGFGAVSMLSSIVAVWSFIANDSIVEDARQVIYGDHLDGLLAQKKVDHLNWAIDIRDAFLRGDRRIAVQTDSRQ